MIVKTCTINVQGMNDPMKYDDIIEWIEENDYDITVLTETKLKPTLALNSFKTTQKTQKNPNNQITQKTTTQHTGPLILIDLRAQA